MPRTPAPTAAAALLALALALGAGPAEGRTGLFSPPAPVWATPSACRTGTTDREERRLGAALVYTDSRGTARARPGPGHVWTARPPLCTDGASIPGFAQRVFGEPFAEDVIGPAVIHDWYVRHGDRGYADTHWVFYDALRSAGVPRRRALPMYLAVLVAGPFVTPVKVQPAPPGADPFAATGPDGTALTLSTLGGATIPGAELRLLQAQGIAPRALDDAAQVLSLDRLPPETVALPLPARTELPAEVLAIVDGVIAALEVDPKALSEADVENLALDLLQADPGAALRATLLAESLPVLRAELAGTGERAGVVAFEPRPGPQDR